LDDYDACAESFGPLATLGCLVAPEPGEVEARKDPFITAVLARLEG
jgi:hypothetical protein